MVARDGIEPPTPAFSGLLTEPVTRTSIRTARRSPTERPWIPNGAQEHCPEIFRISEPPLCRSGTEISVCGRCVAGN
jgi:hypothetical protein